jgi:CheY-like chemotaxis protein
MSIPNNILDGWKVVVVEDEADSLEVATLLLEMYGAQVIGARNGREGIAMILKHRPNFVISDLSMPEMSGWELIETLNQGERDLAEIPVIALTAHAMDHDRRKAIEAGFQNFITKPLQPEKFVSQVIAILAVDSPELRALVEE